MSWSCNFVAQIFNNVKKEKFKKKIMEDKIKKEDESGQMKALHIIMERLKDANFTTASHIGEIENCLSIITGKLPPEKKEKEGLRKEPACFIEDLVQRLDDYDDIRVRISWCLEVLGELV